MIHAGIILQRDGPRLAGERTVTNKARRLNFSNPVRGGAAVDMMVAVVLSGKGMRDQDHLAGAGQGLKDVWDKALLDMLQKLTRPDEIKRAIRHERPLTEIMSH